VRIFSAIVTMLVTVAPLGAQQRPDTVPASDSARVVLDTLVRRPLPDTVPDSLRFYVAPKLDGRAPAGFASGVWLFEREDLLATRALSLAGLLADVPGVIRLRGGDYGVPETVTAFGLSGGEIRVLWDGFEQIPLDGAVTDLTRVGLGGIERVRVERHAGELRIELTSMRNFDPRPSSLIEAGTGDFNTNFFRGTFIHPRALGGSLGFTLDRVDTNGAGAGGSENGNRTGGWLRYTHHWGDDVALTAEARLMRSSADVTAYPGKGERGDWVVRGSWRPSSGLVVQGYTGGSTLTGLEVDGRLPVDRGRNQHGATADLVLGVVRASAALRLFGGSPTPSNTLDLSAVAELPGVGGASVSLSRESWDGEGAVLTRLVAWSRPVAGVSLFGSRESGRRGVVLYPRPSLVPAVPDSGELEASDPEPIPGHRLTDRTSLRVGTTFAWRGFEVSAARVTLETDSLPVLGLPMDRDGVVMPGIERTGFEVATRLPLSFLLDGLGLNGDLTQWDEGARYLPKRAYQIGLAFHNRYLPTGNLELWWSLGVEGRDPMLVPVGDHALPEPAPGEAIPVTVPFSQSWYALIQVRILQLRVFVAWENFTMRRNNQDFPDRTLPVFRAHYGIRWHLWN